jgi:uncharacterized membrane protein YiaA
MNPKQEIVEQVGQTATEQTVELPVEDTELTGTPDKTSASPLVKMIVMIGVILVAIGLVVAIFQMAFAILLMFIGAVAIIVAVFGPIRS